MYLYWTVHLDMVSQYFSYIVAVSFIGGGNWSTRRKPPTCRKSRTNLITQHCIECTSIWAGLEPTTLVVICTDYPGSCKPNDHTITTTKAPFKVGISSKYIMLLFNIIHFHIYTSVDTEMCCPKGKWFFFLLKHTK